MITPFRIREYVDFDSEVAEKFKIVLAFWVTLRDNRCAFLFGRAEEE